MCKEWQVISNHTDGIDQYLKKPNYDQTNIFQTEEGKNDWVEKLLTRHGVASIIVDERDVSPWRPVGKGKWVKKWTEDV